MVAYRGHFMSESLVRIIPTSNKVHAEIALHTRHHTAFWRWCSVWPTFRTPGRGLAHGVLRDVFNKTINSSTTVLSSGYVSSSCKMDCQPALGCELFKIKSCENILRCNMRLSSVSSFHFGATKYHPSSPKDSSQQLQAHIISTCLVPSSCTSQQQLKQALGAK